ncbi:hypothetical protein P9D39_23345 [Heyndrickxia oleronia]|jgi:hypothetical protein|uniref:hypothetical protein n=1 Tax=Heyndrickxia oleronia TaxID=38875 RepID=UPI0007171F29|nr:hypothetical protein [Heyndrickxia oleronia]MBU5210261.1 hypothetical protein [Heyndrickxia oleronia]MEC1377215.1 hypothetical protein [Heyndrickxia oleronia]NYV68357.1 hypothetical protein [Bacillus sp. Gen3]QQZ07058.1 hypothetical protein I5818_11985 [Heyndrickxia oleronia]
MLLTPLGTIKLFVNNKEVEFTAIKLDNLELLCPNVNGRYLIQFEYKKEFKIQEIKCCIPSIDVKGEIESGERLEAISFYKNDIKLTIGVEGEFTDYPKYIDFSGDYLSNGIQYEVFQTTASRKFNFGVCWMQPCTEENDNQTWFGADPNFMP